MRPRQVRRVPGSALRSGAVARVEHLFSLDDTGGVGDSTMSDPECPWCGSTYANYPALSRADNTTEICPRCGEWEALADAGRLSVVMAQAQFGPGPQRAVFMAEQRRLNP